MNTVTEFCHYCTALVDTETAVLIVWFKNMFIIVVCCLILKSSMQYAWWGWEAGYTLHWSTVNGKAIYELVGSTFIDSARMLGIAANWGPFLLHIPCARVSLVTESRLARSRSKLWRRWCHMILCSADMCAGSHRISFINMTNSVHQTLWIIVEINSVNT